MFTTISITVHINIVLVVTLPVRPVRGRHLLAVRLIISLTVAPSSLSENTFFTVRRTTTYLRSETLKNILNTTIVTDIVKRTRRPSLPNNVVSTLEKVNEKDPRISRPWIPSLREFEPTQHTSPVGKYPPSTPRTPTTTLKKTKEVTDC